MYGGDGSQIREGSGFSTVEELTSRRRRDGENLKLEGQSSSFSVFSVTDTTPLPHISTYQRRLHHLLMSDSTLVTDDSLPSYDSVVLSTPDDVDPAVYAYKKVAQKVRPVPGVLPEEF